jgi:hypothetical protein
MSLSFSAIPLSFRANARRRGLNDDLVRAALLDGAGTIDRDDCPCRKSRPCGSSGM